MREIPDSLLELRNPHAIIYPPLAAIASRHGYQNQRGRSTPEEWPGVTRNGE